MFFNFLFVFGFLPCFQVIESTNVTISASHSNRALSNDVTVKLHGATGGEVVELFYDKEETPLVGQLVSPRTDEEGNDVTLVFNCGYFSRLGDYRFVASRRNKNAEIMEKVAETIFSAIKYPDINIHINPNHQAFTSDVMVTITALNDLCSSSVTLEYQPKLIMMRDSKVVMGTRDVTLPSSSVIFDCDVFSQKGNYTVQLTMTFFHEDVIIQQSDIMQVDWSNEYAIILPQNVPPCEGKLNVDTKKPPCAPFNDVMEAVAMFNNGSYYVIENATLGNSDSAEFSCSSLQVPSDGICFRYVTSQVVRRTVCRSVESTKDFSVDGDWSMWSYWSTCSLQCSFPIRQRTRLCDNPKQQGQGSHCNAKGSFYEHQVELKDTSKGRTLCSHDDISRPNTSLDCTCGCILFAIRAGVLRSPVSSQCQAKSIVEWKFYVPLNYVIRFRMIDFQLEPGEVVLVENVSSSFTAMTSSSSTVTSTNNVVSLKYVRSLRDDVTNGCGFVIAFEPIDPTKQHVGTTVTTIKNHPEKKWYEKILQNPVVLIAIGACLVFILVAFCCTIKKCKKTKRKDRERNTPGIELENRLIAPPDGKSSSNMDDSESEQTRKCHHSIVTPRPPRAAYYLAQRQLELMRKEGIKNSTQTYNSSCMNDHNIHEQEALLFGRVTSQAETNT